MNRARWLLVFLTLLALATMSQPAAGADSLLPREREAAKTRAHSADSLTLGSHGNEHDTASSLDSVTWTGMTNPGGYYYNLYEISTPYGYGYHIDTAGNNDSPPSGGYDFFAHRNLYNLVGADGGITVKGYFRQDDTFPTWMQPGRRELRIFVIDVDASWTVIAQVPVLNSNDGNAWLYREVEIGELPSGRVVAVGIGRHDDEATDYNISAEWVGVSVISGIAPAPPGLSEVLYRVVVIGLPVGMVAVVAVVAIRRRRRMARLARASVLPRPVAEEHPAEPVKSRRVRDVYSRTDCPVCGALIHDYAAQHCWSCGASLGHALRRKAKAVGEASIKRTSQRCIVCRMNLKEADDTLKCPYCGSIAHRTHILEWLHVKDYCPQCRMHLDEKELQ